MIIGFFASFNETAGGIFQYACSMFGALRKRQSDKFIAFIAPNSPLRAYLPAHWQVVELPPYVFTTNADRIGNLASNGIELLQRGCNRRASAFFREYGVELLLFAAPEMIAFESDTPYLMPIHDLQHRIQPHFPEVSSLGTWHAREYLFLNGAKFADGILVDSETGKEDVLNYYGSYISPNKLFVLPLAPAYTSKHESIPSSVLPEIKIKYRLPERYFFYPAQFWQHKNHARLIHALHILRVRHKIDAHIAFVGSRAGGAQEAREKVYELAMHLAEQLGVQDLCHYLGYAPDEDMPALYKGAVALVMPTMFGPTNTPVSEAWGFDCPVITSDIRGIREHLGNAGLLVNPNSAESIANAMIRLLNDDNLRLQLIQKGKIRYEEYNQERFADKLYDALDKIANNLSLVRKKTTAIFPEALSSDEPGFSTNSNKPAADSNRIINNTAPIVSAIVSVYKSERFMRGLFNDLLAQTLYKQGNLEIVIVNSNSPENEDLIIQEYANKYPNIIYIKTENRETIYETWNRGVKASSGKYITSANTDDRHRPDALEIMAKALDFLPNVGLAYADCLATNIENEEFMTTRATLRYDLPDFTLGAQLNVSCFGAQPLWRRSAHDKIGGFDSQYTIAGDYDFFIRLAWKFGAVHVRETLGLFLARRDSASGSDNTKKTIAETLHILRKYRSEIPPESIYHTLANHIADPFAKAAALWDYGNLCALSPYYDFELALKYYDQSFNTSGISALEKDQIKYGILNNGGAFAYCIGNQRQALDLLEQAKGKTAEAEYNYALIIQAANKNTQLRLSQFKLMELSHIVIDDSRSARSLLLADNGAFTWSDFQKTPFWNVHTGINGTLIDKQDLERAKKMSYSKIDKNNNKELQDQSSRSLFKNKAKRILFVMYGWDEEGGGTLLPRTIAEYIGSQGRAVAVFYAGAKLFPEKGPYYILKNRYNNIELCGVFNRPALFFDLENPKREIEDATIRSLFADYLDEFKPDLIHFHNLFNLSMAIVEEAHKRNIPSIFTPHNYWLLCPKLYLIDAGGKVCDGPDKTGNKCAVCIGRLDLAKDYARRLNYGIDIAKNYFTYNLAPSSRAKAIFISAGHYSENIKVLRQASPAVDDIIRRRKPYIRGKIFRIGYLGAILPLKGVHILVEAAQHLNGQEAEILLYGSVSKEYEDLLRKIDVGDLVRFRGAYSYAELPDILDQLDVLAAPSLVEETGGLAAAEALAAGVPVVASNIGGLTDAIRHGVNGMLFQPGNTAELSGILSGLIHNTTLYATLRNNAKPEKAFSDFAEELMDIYENITDNSK